MGLRSVVTEAPEVHAGGNGAECHDACVGDVVWLCFCSVALMWMAEFMVC